MKVVVALALGLVAGYLLGGIGPRRALREEDERAQALERELAAARSRQSFLELLFARTGDGAVGADAPPSGPPVGAGAAEAPTVPRPAAWAPSPDEPDADAGHGARPLGGPRARAPEEGRASGVEAAISAQAVRALQTRAALREQAGLDEEELARIDGIVEDLSRRLEARVGDVRAVLEASTLEPAPSLRLLHTLSGILADGQESFEAVLGPRAATLDPDVRPVWNLIELERFRAALEAAAERRAPGERASP